MCIRDRSYTGALRDEIAETDGSGFNEHSLEFEYQVIFDSIIGFELEFYRMQIQVFASLLCTAKPRGWALIKMQIN